MKGPPQIAEYARRRGCSGRAYAAHRLSGSVTRRWTDVLIAAGADGLADGGDRVEQFLGEDGPYFDPVAGQAAGAVARSVDRADDVGHGGSQVAQGPGRGDDRAAGGDDVLDQYHRAVGRIAALGELASAVVLGLLAHEQRGDTGGLAEHGDQRDSAEFQSAEQVGAIGYERPHRAGHLGGL